LNGSTKAHRHVGIYNHQTTGSAISLTPSDEEEPSHVYATVIHTIVGIARSCKDEKITALALSILIQKYGRVNQTVDTKIITESALLGVHSGPSELRSLLKLYSRLSHDSLVKNDVVMLEAVRVPF
jgi:phosphatidylinositol 4-kinase